MAVFNKLSRTTYIDMLKLNEFSKEDDTYRHQLQHSGHIKT